MTVATFKDKFNAECSADSGCGFRMENEWRTEGEFQDVVQSLISETNFLHMTVYKNGELREVVVMCVLNDDDALIHNH